MQYPMDDTGKKSGAAVVPQQGESMWDQLGSMLGGNQDLLLGAAGAFSKYQRQQADNKAQDYINQAAAKWSGFNPNLMNMVKPTTAPDPVALAQQAAIGAPVFWNNIQQIYEAREAAKRGDRSQFDQLEKKRMAEEALKAGINPGSMWGQNGV